MALECQLNVHWIEIRQAPVEVAARAISIALWVEI